MPLPTCLLQDDGEEDDGGEEEEYEEVGGCRTAKKHAPRGLGACFLDLFGCSARAPAGAAGAKLGARVVSSRG